MAASSLAWLEVLYARARNSGDQVDISAFNDAATEHAARIGADLTDLVRIIADTYNVVHLNWDATHPA
jgi:hypothetical protein